MNLHKKKLGIKNYIWDPNSEIEWKSYDRFFTAKSKKRQKSFLMNQWNWRTFIPYKESNISEKYDFTINVFKNQFLMNFWRSYGKKYIFFIFHWFCLWYKPLKIARIVKSALQKCSVRPIRPVRPVCPVRPVRPELKIMNKWKDNVLCM